MIIQGIDKNFADGLASIAKNPEFIYGYFKRHYLGLIPNDWDPGMFLTGCVKLWDEIFAISFETNIDIDKIDPRYKKWQLDTMRENKKLRDELNENSEEITVGPSEVEVDK